MLTVKCRFRESTIHGKWHRYLLWPREKVDLPVKKWVLVQVGDVVFMGTVTRVRVKTRFGVYEYRAIYVPTRVARELIRTGISPGADVEAKVLAVIDPQTKIATIDAATFN